MNKAKRVMDLSILIIFSPFFLPLIIILSILVWMKIGSPIFFKQLRPGINGEIFEIIKFRTMKNIFGPNQELLPDVERLTEFGKFLRSTSLDEIPEIWNILMGEMSFVGPRPLLVEYLPMYTEEQAIRHHITPGITGWAQINGRNNLSWDDKFALDIWYVKNRTLMLDLQILVITLIKVIKRDGINQAGEFTVSKFKGVK